MFLKFFMLFFCVITLGFSAFSYEHPKQYAGTPQRVYLKGWKKYLYSAVQLFMIELEDYGLCSHFLTDFNQNISQRFFDHEVHGQVLYTNGFWGSLQNSYLRESFDQYYVDQEKMEASVKCHMIIEDVLLYFDFYANLTTGNFGGTVAVPYESVEFDLYVKKDLRTNIIDGVFDGFSAKIPRNSKWYYEPDNALTQIFFRSAKYDFFDDLHKLGNSSLKEVLNTAISKLSFPELCFNCNSATDE